MVGNGEPVGAGQRSERGKWRREQPTRAQRLRLQEDLAR